IISGFAQGIDIVAHKKALDLGLETVAVLGHPFGEWYPPQHTKYVPALLKNGAFVSEFWSDDPFDRSNFLKRNRIIAGAAHATVVIESGSRGGSLVTAQHALAYHREVFAFPGRPSDEKRAG
ncbi:MAG: DNA-processing protein DprA, partial [Candidatus Arcticimaribacter sp.]